MYLCYFQWDLSTPIASCCCCPVLPEGIVNGLQVCQNYTNITKVMSESARKGAGWGVGAWEEEEMDGVN